VFTRIDVSFLASLRAKLEAAEAVASNGVSNSALMPISDHLDSTLIERQLTTKVSILLGEMRTCPYLLLAYARREWSTLIESLKILNG
jgi:hypothetical protein